MSSVFAVHPQTVSIKQIVSGRVSFSASDYRTILKPASTKRLSTLVDKYTKGREIGSKAYMPHSSYRFLKTANITESFTFDETGVEFCRPCKGVVEPHDGAILIARDGAGQGLGECCVYNAREGITDYISQHILSLEFTNEQDRNYIFGVLKSPHFREYLDGVTPGGSTIRQSGTLIMDYELPWSQDSAKRQIVADIVASLLHKERLITAKNVAIDELISEELRSGSSGAAAPASSVSRSELLATTRLDAGMYADLVRKTDRSIVNYKGGYYHIPDYFRTKRGQNLQVTSISKSYYSDTPKIGFYRLFTTAEMTNERTITGFRWLGNRNRLSTLPKECVMLAAKGTVGRSVFFDELPNTTTNIDQWIVTAKDSSQPRYRTIFLSLFLSYLRNIGYLDKIKDKSNGGGLTKKPISKWIKIPSFPAKMQEEIAGYYYKVADPLGDDATLADQMARDANTGIFQLNMEVLALREHLLDVVKDIIFNG